MYVCVVVVRSVYAIVCAHSVGSVGGYQFYKADRNFHPEHNVCFKCDGYFHKICMLSIHVYVNALGHRDS